LISASKQAYQTGDVATLQTTLPQMISFIEEAIKDFDSETKMYANGGVRVLRLLNKNAQAGVIGERDEEGFVKASKFLAVRVLLPDLKKTDPQAVKDAGLWDKGE
jgi:hypothetical protein